MIHPLTRFSVKGAIWYQGESNTHNPDKYSFRFPSMVNDWRRSWGNDDLGFYFVQLANYMEADAAVSKKDFRHKISLCKKESKETKHWLRMIAKANPGKEDDCRLICNEAQELTLIFSSILLPKKGQDPRKWMVSFCLLAHSAKFQANNECVWHCCLTFHFAFLI